VLYSRCIVVSLVYIFIFSGDFNSDLVKDWGWAFAFALFIDLVLLEFLVVAFSVITILIVGSAADACGGCRNLWLAIVP
jgi:hypothetical protein